MGAVNRAFESSAIPGVPLPGIGKANTVSRLITESPSGDVCIGDRGASQADKGEGICELMLLAGVGIFGWRNARSDISLESSGQSRKSIAGAYTYWLLTDRCAEELPGQAFLPWPWSVGLETRAPRREEEMEWAH